MKVTGQDEMSSARGRATLSDRSLAAWEIVSVLSSAVIAEWIFVAAADVSKLMIAIPLSLAFILMVVSHRERGENLKDLGFRFDNFIRAAFLLLPPMLLVTFVFLVVGHFSQAGVDFLRWGAGRSLAVKLTFGVGWGLIQQYVLQGFINRRLMTIVGPGWLSVALVAAIFAGLHLPNLWLACITLAGGVIWAAIYQRTPNLFATAVSHAVMTWVLISTIPPTKLDHLRLGIKYFG